MENVLLGGVAVFYLLAISIALAASVFWIVELVDVVRRQFADPTMKVVWLLVVLFAHGIGALVYYFVGKPMGTLPGSYAPSRPSSPPDSWPPPPSL